MIYDGYDLTTCFYSLTDTVHNSSNACITTSALGTILDRRLWYEFDTISINTAGWGSIIIISAFESDSVKGV
jgi:hypothetical protein